MNLLTIGPISLSSRAKTQRIMGSLLIFVLAGCNEERRSYGEKTQPVQIDFVLSSQIDRVDSGWVECLNTELEPRIVDEVTNHLMALDIGMPKTLASINCDNTETDDWIKNKGHKVTTTRAVWPAHSDQGKTSLEMRVHCQVHGSIDCGPAYVYAIWSSKSSFLVSDRLEAEAIENIRIKTWVGQERSQNMVALGIESIDEGTPEAYFLVISASNGQREYLIFDAACIEESDASCEPTERRRWRN